ncbi:UNVERIFIED_CONTAM: hypothetical protein Slati_2410000 [Sesamum latifolium]|uniref:Tf2-1-like SH3-like domain-containing protein n=1 Tax=Sesamum latifolium TaxID=2727402 RepID=A0AAW2WC20_9LAMI
MRSLLSGQWVRDWTASHPQTDEQSERTILILEDMLRACALDFGGSWKKHLPLIEFAYNNSYQSTFQMAPYEALYGRKCRSPLHWDLDDQKQSRGDNREEMLQPELVQEAIDKVSPRKEITRFGKRNKLKPRYIGPCEIIKRVEKVAYKLNLPPNTSRIHDVFHVSHLKKYYPNPSHILQADTVELEEDLSYQERPICILDKKIQELRNRRIPLVKVLWQNHGVEEATWEREDELRRNHPGLFNESTDTG